MRNRLISTIIAIVCLLGVFLAADHLERYGDVTREGHVLIRLSLLIVSAIVFGLIWRR